MKKYYFLLLALTGCGQNATEHQVTSAAATSRATKVQPTALRPTTPAKPTVAYTSGDRATVGPLDTLHVGRSLVLRLKPGNKNDFPPSLYRYPVFSEARLIRQAGNGRVQRVDHTLIVRPFNGPALRFTDNTHQMRKDGEDMSDVECRFLGSIPGRPYWLVDSALWEHTQPFLINKQSGRLISVPWDPDISPNRKLLFIASPGLDSPATDNTIQLWSISDQTVTLLWARRLQQWQPQRVRWLTNHTIAIQQFRFEPELDSAYVRLILSN